MLNEKEVKDIIFKAQMAGYPNKNIPEILAPLYTYVEQMESEINRLQVALDATVAEKEQYKRALSLSCEYIREYHPGLSCEPVRDVAYWLHKSQAKEVFK